MTVGLKISNVQPEVVRHTVLSAPGEEIITLV